MAELQDLKVWKNKCKCKICGDIIESKSVHNFVECGCGACYTDGGLEYNRRGWDPKYGGYEDVIENIIENVKEDEYEEYNIPYLLKHNLIRYLND